LLRVLTLFLRKEIEKTLFYFDHLFLFWSEEGILLRAEALGRFLFFGPTGSLKLHETSLID